MAKLLTLEAASGEGDVLFIVKYLKAKAWDNLAIWYHPRLLQDWPQRQTAYFCVRISQGSANPSQNRDNTLSDELYPEEGVKIKPNERRLARQTLSIYMPQGLGPASRVFTKILKPVFAHFCAHGIEITGYIDDS